MNPDRRRVLYKALFAPSYRSIGHVRAGLRKLAREFGAEIGIRYGEKLHYQYVDFSIAGIAFQARSYAVARYSGFEIFLDVERNGEALCDIGALRRHLMSISFLEPDNISWISRHD